MPLDSRLTWKTHILIKNNELWIRFRELLWLIDENSKITQENKILIYKAILKPVWTYAVQLWGVAAQSNIDIIQHCQSKVLRIITNASNYISNIRIHGDLEVSNVQYEISRFSSNYRQRSQNQSKPSILSLTNRANNIRRLIRPHTN